MSQNYYNCKYSSVDNDCHKSYLVCDKGVGCLDKDQNICTDCKEFTRR